MMIREVEKLLIDVKESIGSIESYLGSESNFNEFLEDKMKRRAIERELEIIGEAIKRLLNIEPEIEIKDAIKIVDFRNRISHGYDNIDNTVVWGIITRDLPKLKIEVEALLKSE
jgi:uncharacterized protein with HEPN domain